MANQYKFKAVLVAPDGAKVEDFRGKDSAEEVNELLWNMGSRWFFYPFAFVVSETTNKVIIPNDAFQECKGWNIVDVISHIKLNPEYCEMILAA